MGTVSRKKTTVEVAVSVCALLLLFLLCLLPSVAGDESVKRRLVETTHEKEIVSTYEEIDQMKVLTISVLGAMPPADVTSETESWCRLVWQTIDSFNEIQTLSGSKTPEDHIEALYTAYSLQQTLTVLEDKAPTSAIAMLPEIALGRALTEQAEYLEDAATREKQTKKRIEYLNQSASAFHESGDISNFARLDYETKELTARYKADMRIANAMLENATRFFSEGMQIPTSKPLLPLGAFLNLRASKELVNRAIVIYEKHSDEKRDEAYPLRNAVEPEFTAVVVEMIWKLLLYTMTLFLIGTYVLRAAARWRNDISDSRLGNVLVR
jgi:hypothetical protein